MTDKARKLLEEPKYPVKEAAPMIGVSESWMRQKIYQGEIESLKIGRKRLVTESTLLRILKEAIVKHKR